jgi:hypothetical protein
MTNGARERPFGVTLLAILYMLEGVLVLLFPILFNLILSGFLGEMGGFLDFSDLAAVSITCWIVFAIIAMLYFLIAFGLLAGKGWARIIAIIFAIIGLLNIPIGTIISIIILIYLFKADVKAYFH